MASSPDGVGGSEVEVGVSDGVRVSEGSGEGVMVYVLVGAGIVAVGAGMVAVGGRGVTVGGGEVAVSGARVGKGVGEAHLDRLSTAVITSSPRRT